MPIRTLYLETRTIAASGATIKPVFFAADSGSCPSMMTALLRKEVDFIMDDNDAFVEAWDKAFPGDTYTTASDEEFNIRQAHAAEMYERTLPKPEG